jgi:hypothetical protein
MAAPADVIGALVASDLLTTMAAKAAKITAEAALSRIARYIYEKLDVTSALKGGDYDGYQKLVQCYRIHLSTDSLPEQWTLADKKPVYRSTFKEQKAQLLHELESLKQSDSSLKEQIMAIVNTIGDLYCSLDKRVKVFSVDLKRGDGYREDGFESMFYTELAVWLVAVLPTLSVTDEKTAKAVEQRIKYCEEVFKILFYRNDREIACPRNILPVVIRDLTVLHKNLLQAHRAASFGDRISNVNGLLSSAIADSLNVLYMILDGIRLPNLHVGEVLSPSDGRLVKIQDTVYETKLGQWLIATLKLADIRANDFACHRSPSILAIEDHLVDISLSEKEDVGALGFPDFIWRRDYTWAGCVTDPTHDLDARSFRKDPKTIVLLEHIRDFHRAILKLCCVREALMRACQIQVAYGEEWLFDSEDGSLLFDALMYMIDKSMVAFNDVLLAFWTDFYTERHASHVKAKKTDAKDITYQQLAVADDHVKKIQDIIKRISEHATALNTYRLEARGSSEKHKENLSALSRFLYAYLPSIGYRHSAHLARFYQLGLIGPASEGSVPPGYPPNAAAGAGSATSHTEIVPDPVIPAISVEEQARASMMSVLCSVTHLNAEEIQPAWIENGYRLFLPSFSTLGEKAQETVKSSYDGVITAAREFAAETIARRLICKSIGQDPNEIKSAWVEKAKPLFLLQLQGSATLELAEAQRDYEAVIETLDRLKKLAAVRASIALCDYTGKAPNDILRRWIIQGKIIPF